MRREKPREWNTRGFSRFVNKRSAASSGGAVRSGVFGRRRRSRNSRMIDSHDTTSGAAQLHSSSTSPATSNHVQSTSKPIGRRNFRFNGSKRHVRRVGWGASNTSNEIGYLSRTRGVCYSFCLVPEGRGISLDVLDVRELPPENSPCNSVIVTFYVQECWTYIGRDWTFKKGVAA